MSCYKYKNIIFFLSLFFFIGCSKDWRDEYFEHEVYKEVTLKRWYEFDSTEYKFWFADSSFETFNEQSQRISNDHMSFYAYDISGKIIKNTYCLREQYDNPLVDRYYYDTKGNLIKITTESPFKNNNYDSVRENNTYDSNGLLVTKKFGSKPQSRTEIFTYYDNKNVKTITRRFFNENVNKWDESLVTLFYDDENNCVRKQKIKIGEDLLTISNNYYDSQKRLTKSVDTTLTSRSNTKLIIQKNTVHHAYYGKREYKYDTQNRLLEEIIYRPDYKTPYAKIEYEYKKYQIKSFLNLYYWDEQYNN
ncbi:MAG: hypothetical protein HYZ34_04820 [Ignavibacteriae bacterium]|nr:hypothetical protein [Ignavibacteriota bacterium]